MPIPRALEIKVRDKCLNVFLYPLGLIVWLCEMSRMLKQSAGSQKWNLLLHAEDQNTSIDLHTVVDVQQYFLGET